ncbi:MAG: sigma-70 family RNA polymerase sigma factor [Muribaculaceae bacterium]|nr:sigma-70 family RNA polymerase sigma factor [Muribaculaceae bacterium]
MNYTDTEFEELVRKYESTIYSICYMYSDFKEQTDDLFQESLTNIWRSMQSYRKECNLNSWVYRITLNTCLSYKRKKQIKTEPLDIHVELFNDSSDIGSQSRLLHQRIQCLDVVDRAIVLLWLENMSYDEIGDIVGMTAKTIGVRLVRIKEKLKSKSKNK